MRRGTLSAGIAACAVLTAASVCDASIVKDGDPAFFVAFPSEVQYIQPGETWTWEVGPSNFGFLPTTPCQESDTFCVTVGDLLGWTIIGDPPLGVPTVLDPGFFWWQEIVVTAACDATVGQLDTVTAVMSYSDGTACYPDSGDCVDPNIYGDDPRYSTITVVFEVVPATPAIYILQDTLYFVTQGQCAAYVPFSVCNGDPCSGAAEFICEITSAGHIGEAIDQFDTVTIEGGSCEDVYGVVNARMSPACTFDTLTIVAWDAATGAVYDTCVQTLHVLEPF